MEIWKEIKGFEGLYSISNLGNIRSHYNGSTKLLVLKPKKNGYVCAQLSRSGVITNVRVHRLVALEFIDNPENKQYVNHIDGVKDNNNVNNLEWATPSENDLHAYSKGLRVSPKVWSGKTGADHSRSVKISQFDTARNFIKNFDSVTEAENETGTAHQNIVKVCQGKRQLAGGYKWEYAN